MPYKLSPGTRVLKMRRISRDSEDSSALARQAEALDGAVGESRFDVVGDVEDSFISGAVRPEERPGLGRWMREPLWYEWDAIMVTSLDRITRNQTHWEMFADKCYQDGKDVICLDDPALDITPGNGRMIAYIKATQAQEYREAIVQKRRNQTQYYRDECLWGGGTWPFGYRPVLTEYQGRQRYKLLIDRVTGPLIREAYERIAEQGWSMSRLCQDWNERGVLTSQDYQRSVNGAEKKAGVKTAVKGSKWTTSTLGKMLKKPILKGIAMHKGEPLLRDGVPVRWADPILSDEEFDKLQAAVSALGRHRAGIKSNASPMAGVLYCPCGRKMYENSSIGKLNTGDVRQHKYFRCSSWSNGKACDFSVSWSQDQVYAAAEHAFLVKLGGEEITERHYVPGRDNRKQIKELERAIDNLSQSITLAASPVVVASLTRAMEAHASNLEELMAEPFVPGRWEATGTGQTYAEKWSAMTGRKEQGSFLRQAGMRLFIWGRPGAKGRGIAVHVISPNDVAERASDALAGSVDPADEEAWNLEALKIFNKVLGAEIDELRSVPLQ
ncbi:recombinase family protein [Streptomyces virginiae]|uniref:Recombinase family protein n=1 Tax=Streptomyces virginiae TaxID=1961 RepID=A0ABZ1TGQ9_STRVG|nr:recombinase family protein [Streptomyces virginiae]